MASGGDLTVSINVRSEKDLANKAIEHMLEQNSAVFSEIQIASEQVSSGSQQVAQASHLACGLRWHCKCLVGRCGVQQRSLCWCYYALFL